MSDDGFTARLKATRRGLGMTQREAAGAELTASYVSLLESGKRTPTAAAVLALCRRLGVQPVDLGAEDLVDAPRSESCFQMSMELELSASGCTKYRT